MQNISQIASILEEFHLRNSFGSSAGGTKDMSFFNDCVVHICRSARVFRQQGGHLLLVGLDGTGKRTTVQLAAKIAQCELYTLTITRNYGVAEFREELKTIFKLCGGSESSPVVFLVTDSDLIMVSSLDLVCMVSFLLLPIHRRTKEQAEAQVGAALRVQYIHGVQCF